MDGKKAKAYIPPKLRQAGQPLLRVRVGDVPQLLPSERLCAAQRLRLIRNEVTHFVKQCGATSGLPEWN